MGVLLDLAANADAPALRSVAARSVPLALERVRTPRLVQAASRRLAHQAEEADAAPIVFGGAKDPRTNRIESPLAACLGAVADLGRPDGVKAALAALERDDLDAIEAGLTYFVRLGDPGHAAAIATRMRPPGGDAFVNALFGRRLEDLTGQRLGADRQAWQRWAASRQVGPPGPEDGPR